MPPWLDSAEEVGAVAVAVLAVLGTIGAAVLGTVAALVAAWRAKVKPLLSDTRAAAEISAHQLQNNSGSSTRDAIDRTERMTGHLIAEMRDLRADQRASRDQADRAHSEIFRRLRVLESPPEDTRP